MTVTGPRYSHTVQATEVRVVGNNQIAAAPLVGAEVDVTTSIERRHGEAFVQFADEGGIRICQRNVDTAIRQLTY